jgi:tRNA(Ile)-lysidine synthase
MASSRKPRRKADADGGDAAAVAPVLTALRAALAAAREADDPAASLDTPLVAAGAARRRPRAGPLVIGFSGGRDSTVLLHAACALRDARVPGWRDLLAVHVNHGLQAGADAWAEHCHALCAQWQVPIEIVPVSVARGPRGIEAAARDARYAALAEVAQRVRARFVLTAHHRDDRIESFLIAWLRGAGPDGLAAMPAARPFADGQRVLLRPLLDLPRAQIDAYARSQRLQFVDDPSNADIALLRNAIRHQVLPALAAVRPGFEAAAARSVDLVADASQALRALAADDLAACSAGVAAGALRLDRLAFLAPARQRLVLRAWLTAAGIEAPSLLRLNEVLTQALTARSDARLLVRLAGGAEVRRHRGLLVLHVPQAIERSGRQIHWQGEEEIALPEWGGALRFEPAGGEGFDPDWLREMPLEVRARGGGERFKPHPTRPSKTLKRLFQDAGIAEFQRGALPLVWRVDARGERLIYVAGLGPDARLVDADGPRIALRWQPVADLIARSTIAPG